MMDTIKMNLPTLALSKAQIVSGCAFIIFVLSSIAIFTVYQSDDIADIHSNAEIPLNPLKPLNPLSRSPSDLEQALSSVANDAIGISDFGQRLDATDQQLRSLEQSMVRLQDELSNYKNIVTQTSQSLATELQKLKNKVSQLAAADDTLNNTLNRITVFLQKFENQQPPQSSNELPVVGLKLLSVSIWDDGAVAIVSLGDRKTGLSVGNFFAGLKVEDISVAEQSLTLYEPATDKLYTLYADAIVYKETRAP